MVKLEPHIPFFDDQAVPAGILVHGCNAQGVMGAGFAEWVRNTCPPAFRTYRKAYETEGLKLGSVVWHVLSENPKKVVANAITQKFYGTERPQADLHAIRSCMSEVAAFAAEHNIPVFLPKIGAGLGGLTWDQVSPVIAEALGNVEWTLLEPVESKRKPRRTVNLG